MIYSNDIHSKMIAFLRFPLIVLVICIHATEYSTTGTSGFDLFFIDLFANIISRIAVPLFFIISSFLFFKKNDFSKEVYTNKIKRRIHSLLVPFIIWNCLAYALLAIVNKDFSLTGILPAFINYKHTGIPVAFQFWFIRDLIILNMISPLIFYIIKNKTAGAICVFIFLVLFILYGNDQAGLLNLSSIAFYVIGAWLSINNFTFDKIAIQTGNWPFIYFVLIIVDYLTQSSIIHIQIHNIGIIIGILLSIRLTFLFVSNNNLSFTPKLAPASFFVYAVHVPWCLSLGKKFLNLIQCPAGIIYYLAIVLISALLGLLIYGILKKISPQLLGLLSGNR